MLHNSTFNLHPSAIRPEIDSIRREAVVEILNLQPKGHQAKPYQVRQIRQVILKYRLGGDLYAQ